MFFYNMKTPKKSGSLVLNCLNCGALYEYQYETDCHKKGQRMSELSRLKPDPIPTIHPIPEYAADAALTAVYERTKSGFGVPWMGVVAMAFAHYREFYNCLWQAMEPVVVTQAFADACKKLRFAAEKEATSLNTVAICSKLTKLGYDDREIEEIKNCNEVFSSGNMPYVLMATLARLLLEGHSWEGKGPTQTHDAPGITVKKPALIELHHADPTIAAVYADVRQTLGLPFVNTDYRAFARWPSYFNPAWTDLRSIILREEYEPAVRRVHDAAVSLASGLPNMSKITPQQLIDCAKQDGQLSEVVSVVRLFQWLLPGLAVNVAVFRHQLL